MGDPVEYLQHQHNLDRQRIVDELKAEGYRIVKLAAWDDVMYEYSSLLPWYVKEEL